MYLVILRIPIIQVDVRMWLVLFLLLFFLITQLRLEGRIFVSFPRRTVPFSVQAITAFSCVNFFFFFFDSRSFYSSL